jgi:hypothetical protein
LPRVYKLNITIIFKEVKMRLKVILAVMLLVQSNVGLAEDAQVAKNYTIKPMIVIGIASGGDELGDITYENGDTLEITAGGGFTFGGGFDVQSTDKPIGAMATINYHSDSADASNGSISMDRFEFTVLPYYQLNERVQVALGLSMHTGVEYEEDYYGTTTVEFDSAFATLVELRYVFENKNMALSGRYTSVDYDASEVDGRSISGIEPFDGSNVVLFFTWSFDQ